MDKQALLNEVILIARDASALILKYYEGEIAVDEKTDGSPSARGVISSVSESEASKARCASSSLRVSSGERTTGDGAGGSVGGGGGAAAAAAVELAASASMPPAARRLGQILLLLRRRRRRSRGRLAPHGLLRRRANCRGEVI